MDLKQQGSSQDSGLGLTFLETYWDIFSYIRERQGVVNRSNLAFHSQDTTIKSASHVSTKAGLWASWGGGEERRTLKGRSTLYYSTFAFVFFSCYNPLLRYMEAQLGHLATLNIYRRSRLSLHLLELSSCTPILRIDNLV